MKYISIGDVVADEGINTVKEHLPRLINEYKPDFIIVNIENIADGLGVDKESFDSISSIKEIDCFVLGNHTWDKADVSKYINDPRVIRPYNYGQMPGKGFRYYKKDNYNIFVIQLMGQVYIDKKLNNPFLDLDKVLEEIDMFIEKNNRYKDKEMEEYIHKENIYIFLDFHVGATSEAVAMGYYADGRVSSVLGSHTHVQTADERILPNGTAYLTDMGMTGPYESVLGMDIDIAFERFINGKKAKYNASTSKTNILSGVCIEFNDETKKVEQIIRIREIY